MREVGVHLDDVVIAMLQRPFEPGNVGGAEAQLASALHQMHTLGVLANEFAHDGGSAVGRTVVNHKHVELVLGDFEHSLGDGTDVFLLVISGYDNDAIALHNLSIFNFTLSSGKYSNFFSIGHRQGASTRIFAPHLAKIYTP